MCAVSVPVIDISGDPRRVADEVGAACREIGFLTVVGHGVPEDSSSDGGRARARSSTFPTRRSARSPKATPTPGLPAYRPLRSESLAASLGQKTPGDLKESLDWGPAVPGFGWPARPPELRARFEDYFAAVSGLGERLRRLFALALDLHEDWFEDAFRGHSSSMRVINYPAPEGDAEPGQLRAGAHTDYGCMTILRTEDAPGGLQVQTRGGDWLDVHAVPGSFVVNLGDMMARWTNDRWQATLHRVAVAAGRPRAGSRRQTIVFFHDPRADAVIECIPGCGEPPLRAGDTLEHHPGEGREGARREDRPRDRAALGGDARRASDMQADWLAHGPHELLEEARALLDGPAPPRIYLAGCGDSHFAGTRRAARLRALERDPDAGGRVARALALRARARARRLLGGLRVELGPVVRTVEAAAEARDAASARSA